MRPGMKEMEDFAKGEIISIVDINNKKPLAVGMALFSSEEIKLMQGGKAVKNLHYVGDKIWGFA
jgi:PUA domain protein